MLESKERDALHETREDLQRTLSKLQDNEMEIANMKRTFTEESHEIRNLMMDIQDDDEDSGLDTNTNTLGEVVRDMHAKLKLARVHARHQDKQLRILETQQEGCDERLREELEEMLSAERQSEIRIRDLQERLRYSHQTSERLQDVEYECETLRKDRDRRDDVEKKYQNTIQKMYVRVTFWFENKVRKQFIIRTPTHRHNFENATRTLRGELEKSRKEMITREETSRKELDCTSQKLKSAESKLENASDRILTLSCDLRDAKQRLLRAQSRKDTAMREASRAMEDALRVRQKAKKSMSSIEMTRLCLSGVDDDIGAERKRMKFTREQEDYVILLERTIRELRQGRGGGSVDEHARVLKENARLKKMLKTSGGEDDLMRLKYVCI